MASRWPTDPPAQRTEDLQLWSPRRPQLQVSRSSRGDFERLRLTAMLCGLALTRPGVPGLWRSW